MLDCGKNGAETGPGKTDATRPRADPISEPVAHAPFRRRSSLGLGAIAGLVAWLAGSRKTQAAPDALVIEPNGAVQLNSATIKQALTVEGKVQALNDVTVSGNLYLKTDNNHGLSFQQGFAPFPGNKSQDGPVLYGWNGGALGITKDYVKKLALAWSQDQSVAVFGALSARTVSDENGRIIPAGTIFAFAGAKPPKGWLLCDGSKIPDGDQYADLKLVLGKNTVPDLRGRTLIGAGKGGQSQTDYTVGSALGDESHKMSLQEMPSHQHFGFGENDVNNKWEMGKREINKPGSNGGIDSDNNYFGTTFTGGRSSNSKDQSDNESFSVMQPSAVVTYMVKY